eukprot:GHVP01010732.1.p1 GENE.GHVP01010732.1~~GHVP01010732.1.p1  ORF type:complete len:239 (-),score=14.83 GHVP01010732.1:185-901(-)
MDLSLDIKRELRELPPYTKIILALSIIIPILNLFDKTRSVFLLLPYETSMQLQIWRLISCFFIIDINPWIVIDLIQRVNASRRLEKNIFRNDKTYAVFLVYCTVTMPILGMYFNSLSLWEGLEMAIIHLLGINENDKECRFMYFIPLSAKYLGIARLATRLLLRRDIIPSIIGLITAQSFHYLLNETEFFNNLGIKLRIKNKVYHHSSGRTPLYKHGDNDDYSIFRGTSRRAGSSYTK